MSAKSQLDVLMDGSEADYSAIKTVIQITISSLVYVGKNVTIQQKSGLFVQK
jgi:hypothetical protein